MPVVVAAASSTKQSSHPIPAVFGGSREPSNGPHLGQQQLPTKFAARRSPALPKAEEAASPATALGLEATSPLHLDCVLLPKPVELAPAGYNLVLISADRADSRT